MKRFVTFLTVCLLACTLILSACGQADVKVDQLVVYNWADYIYDYEDDFRNYYQELTGRDIQVTYVTFDTNETMLTKIKNGSVVDVMCPSEYAIQQLLMRDYLLPMNYFGDAKDYLPNCDSLNNYVHNSDNVEKGFREKVSGVFSQINIENPDGTVKETVNMTDYFVPYMYGTLGILYNKRYFESLGIYDREIMNKANWGILFNDNGEGGILSEGLTNRIYMKDSIRDSYAATVFYLLESGQLDGLKIPDANGNDTDRLYTDLSAGELINTVDDKLLALCKDVLTKQKSQLYGYEVDFGKNELIQGIAYVDLAWSGDALYAVEESWDPDYCDPMLSYEEGESGGYTLGYYVPHGTGNIWFDGWVIPKTCKNLEAAKIFVNFLNQPHVGVSNILEIGYTSAVSADVIREECEQEKSLCRPVLSEGYNVYDPDFREDLKTLNDFNGDEEAFESYLAEFDYADWEEFADYFFDYVDPVDYCNWRYPFAVPDDEAEDEIPSFDGWQEDYIPTDQRSYSRSIDDLGVMRDFGVENNQKVSSMWEDVRSTGITAWALFGWTALIFAVAVGVIALAVFLKRRSQMTVILKRADESEKES